MAGTLRLTPRTAMDAGGKVVACCCKVVASQPVSLSERHGRFARDILWPPKKLLRDLLLEVVVVSSMSLVIGS